MPAVNYEYQLAKNFSSGASNPFSSVMSYLYIYQGILNAFSSLMSSSMMKSIYTSQANIARMQTDLMKKSLETQTYINKLQTGAQKEYYETNSYIASLNAKIGEMQAELTDKLTEIQAGFLEDKAKEAREIGHEREARYRQGIKKTIGRQRVALATQGIRIDEGSAEDILLETADIGEIDAVTIKNNAAKESFGYTAQAISTRISGSRTATQQRMGASKQKATATDLMIKGAMAELAGNAESIQNNLKMSWAELSGRSNILDLMTKAKVYGTMGQTEAATSLLTSIGLSLQKGKLW